MRFASRCLLVVCLAVFTASAALAVPACTSGVVTWYQAEDTFLDSAGPSNGTGTNGATFTPSGKVNKAFSFDGTDDYVTAADSAWVRPTSVTIEAWVKFSSSPTTLASIIAKPLGTSFLDSYTIWYDNTGTLRAEISNLTNGEMQVTYPWTPSIGTWYHVAFTFDSVTLNEKLYLDGAQVASATAPGQIQYDNHPLVVGADIQSETPQFFFPGLIDEPTVYNRALSGPEINDIFLADTFGKCSPAIPTVLSVSPTSGPASGGNGITINGASLTSGGVLIGALAPSSSTSTQTMIRALGVPANSPGTYTVSVTTAPGTGSLASAYTYVASGGPYTAAASGNWSNPATWGPSGVPGTGDTVTIGGFVVTLDTNVTVNNLTLSIGTLTGPGNLTVLGAMNWQTGSASTVMSGTGTTTIPFGATLNLNNIATPACCYTRNLERPLVNDGTIIWSGEADFLNINASGSIANNNIFDIQVNALNTAKIVASGGSITNNGTLKKTTNVGTAVIEVPINNTGTVRGVAGILSFDGTFTTGGTWDTDGGTVAFAVGTRTISGAFTNTSSGTFAFKSGVTTLTGTYLASRTDVLGGTVNFNTSSPAQTSFGLLQNGTLSGSSEFKINSNFQWETPNNSTMSGDGSANSKTTLLGEATLALVNPGVTCCFTRFLDNRKIVIGSSATLVWSGVSDRFEFVNNASIENLNGSIIFQNDGDIFDGGGTGTRSITNNEEIRKYPSTGQVDIGVAVHNNADTPFGITVTLGTLSLNGGGTSSGRYVSEFDFPAARPGRLPVGVSGLPTAYGTLRFGGGTHNLTGTSSITAVEVEVAAGVVNVGGTYAAITSNFVGGTMNFNNTTSPATTEKGKLSGASTVLGGSGDFRITGPGNFNWETPNNTTMSGDGTTSSKTTVDAGGTLALTSTGACCFTRFLSNRKIEINPLGTMTWTGQNDNLQFQTGAVLVSSGTVDIQNDGNITTSGSPLGIINFGTFKKRIATGQTDIAVPFTSTGASPNGVLAMSGVLSLNGGTVTANPGTGNYESQSPGTLRFGGGTHTLGAASTVGGSIIEVAAGQVDVAGTWVVTTSNLVGGATNFNNTTTPATTVGGKLGTATATLGGPGEFRISGTFNWETPGTLTMSGDGSATSKTTVLGTGTLALTSSGGCCFTRSLNNRTIDIVAGGTMSLSGQNDFLNFGGGGKITNAGTIDFQNDGDVGAAPGAIGIINTGTFKKTIATGSTDIAVPVTNNGPSPLGVIAQSGVLSLDGGTVTTSTGNYQSQSPGTLRFGGGTHALGVTSTIGGSIVEVGAGQVDVDGVYAVTTSNFFGGTINFKNTTTAATTAGGKLGSAGGSATLTGPGEFRISGTFNWETPGTLTMSGDGSLTSKTTVLGTGTLALSSSGSCCFTRSLNNRTIDIIAGGTMSWSGQNDIFNFGSGGKITNAGTIDFQNDGDVGTAAGAVGIINTGTIKKSAGAAQTDLNVPVTNDAASPKGVIAQSGVLSLNGGTVTTITGNYQSQSPGTLRFGGGTHALGATSTIGGSIVEVGAGQVDVDGVYAVTTSNFFGGTINFKNTTTPATTVGGKLGSAGVTATLTGPGEFRISGMFNWETPGTLTMSGDGSLTSKTTVLGTGTLALTSSGSCCFTRSLNNRAIDILAGGTMSWSGQNDIFNFGSGGKITNAGTIDLQNDGDIGTAAGAVGIINTGTIKKSAGAAQTDLNVPVTNDAASPKGVIAQSGVLSLNGGTVTTSTGNYQSQSPGTLRFGGGTHALGATSTIGGSIVEVGAGQVDVDGVYAVTTSNFFGGTINFKNTTTAATTVGGKLGSAGVIATLTGPGEFRISGTFNWETPGTLTMSGDGSLTSKTTVLGTGTLALTSSGSCCFSRSLNNRAIAIMAGGTMSWSGQNDIFNFGSGGKITNAGTIDLQNDGDIGTAAGAIGIVNNGFFFKSIGALQSAIAPPFTNTNQVQANAGDLRFNGTYTQTAGGLFLQGGGVSINAPNPFDIQGGSVFGAGTITGNVSIANSAAVVPGSAGTAGTLAITGNYTQAPGALLSVDIVNNTTFDRLNVSGVATLDGTLFVNTISAPSGATSFPIVTFASHVGDFAQKNNLSYPGGAYTYAISPTAATLTATTAVPSVLVTNNNDSGPGSLRQAILDANGGLCGPTCTITFTGGVAGPIQLQSMLPGISGTVMIDGTTHPSYAGSPVVILEPAASCTSCPGGLGLVGTGSTIRGLLIRGFSSIGIFLGGGGAHVVEGCTITLNGTGIGVQSSNNRIGGSAAGQRNRIENNTSSGIEGINLLTALPPSRLQPTVNGVVSGSNDNNLIVGNTIQNNGGAGISITNGNNNRIGGALTGEGNIISNNGATVADGVAIIGLSSGNTVIGNAIFDNGGAPGLGIDLDDDGVTANDADDADGGANGRQNTPALSNAQITGSNVTATFSINSSGQPSTAALRVDLYKADSSGAEGQVFLGGTCLAGNVFSNQTITVPAGSLLTGDQVVSAATAYSDATCTTVQNGTSEFSAAVIICPTPQPITAATSVCPLSTGNTASTTLIGGATYTWSITGGTITATSNNTVTYTAAASGTVGLTVTIALGTCAGATSNASVPISAAPSVAITGPTTTCGGSSVTLDAGAGFSSYSWSNGATTRTMTVSPTTTTTYNVTVTNSSGCTASASHTVTTGGAAPTPTITASGPTTFCAGGSVTLTASNGASFLWSTGETTLAITVNQSGSYTVKVTQTGGCFATSAPVTVNVTPAPSVVITAPANVNANEGATATATLSTTAAASYTWSISSGGFITGGQGTATVSFNAGPGPTVSLVVSVDTGGCSVSDSKTISVTPPLPPCPTAQPQLQTPANGEAVAADVAFTWVAVPGAVSYEVWTQLGTDLPVLVATPATNSAFASLGAGTYTWYVIANLSGQCSPSQLTSDTRTFTIAPSPCVGKPAANPRTPAAGSIVFSPVRFTWDAAAGATGYRVWLTRNDGSAVDLGFTNETSLTALVSPGTVKWHVDALHAGCLPVSSAEIPIAIEHEDCSKHTSANLIAPPNSDSRTSSAVEFSWAAVEGADGYRVWIVQDGVPRALGVTLDTKFLGTISVGTVEWYIETLFDGCNSTESLHRLLTIQAASTCTDQNPALLTPAAGAAVASGDVTFSWGGVPGAINYELYLSVANGTKALVAKATSTETTVNVAPGDLEFFVRANVNGCPSRDSDTRTFSFQPPVQCSQVRPILTSPTGGNVTSPVTFRWGHVTTATGYRLHILNSNNVETLVNTNQTTVEDVDLSSGQISWSVEALFGGGCSATESTDSSFLVISAPPACTTLEPPVIAAPGRISSGASYSIEWTSVPRATRYTVREWADTDPLNVISSSTSETFATFSHTNGGATPVTYFYQVIAFDPSCPTGVLSATSLTAGVTILPLLNDGAALASEPQILNYMIRLGPELAGQSFSATPTRPWITVTPTSGTVGLNGTTIFITVNTTGLPIGTTIGSVVISLSGGGMSAVAGDPKQTGGSSSTVPISVTLVAPVTPTPKSAPGPDALIIPAVAAANGFNSKFQSDVRVTNTSPQVMKYQLTFTPSGSEGIASGKQTTIDVDPGRTVALDNVLSTFFATGNENAVGTLEIRPLTQAATQTSSAAVKGLQNFVTFASSRTFNATANGTFGQYIPAIPFANFIGKSASAVLSLQQIAQSAEYRTNLGFVEGSGNPANLLVSVFNNAGTKLTDIPVNLTGGQHMQMGSFLAQQNIQLTDGRVEVRVIGGTGKVTAYASVLNNATGDPLLVSPVTLGETGSPKYVVAGVAELSTGAGWQTDMRIFNAGSTPVQATATFQSMNGGPPQTAEIQLAPGEVKQLDHALTSLFGISNDAGAVHISSPRNMNLVATARTYRNDPNGGNFGQFIQGVTPDEAVALGSRPLQILQVEESTRFRSNIGLAEVSGRPATVEITVIPPDSKVSARIQIPLEANQFRQLNSLLAQMGLGDTHNARVTVKVVQGQGRVTAYASTIDAVTQDPTLIPGQ